MNNKFNLLMLDRETVVNVEFIVSIELTFDESDNCNRVIVTLSDETEFEFDDDNAQTVFNNLQYAGIIHNFL